MPVDLICVKYVIMLGPDLTVQKTIISLVYSMKPMDSDYEDIAYAFPSEYQPLRNHTRLIKCTMISSLIKSIKTRGQYRTIMITMTNELRTVYFDEEGNVRYAGIYLEEIKPLKPTAKEIAEIPTPPPMMKTLQLITKEAIIDKFDGNIPNAETWIRNFEKECARLKIPKEEYCVMLRLFLEDLAKDWYQTKFTLHGTATWKNWKHSFTVHFCTKGWTNCTYAFNYKFIRGSISEYVIKKLKLLPPKSIRL